MMEYIYIEVFMKLWRSFVIVMVEFLCIEWQLFAFLFYALCGWFYTIFFLYVWDDMLGADELVKPFHFVQCSNWKWNNINFSEV